jgi:hypothetical protein
VDTSKIRIGCAAAFWGDTNAAAAQLVRHGGLDYLVFDYLAEITMSILAAARAKDPAGGYAVDFVTEVMAPLAREIAARRIRVVANAGGVNPEACRDALRRVFEAAGVTLRIALVTGDDLQPRRAQIEDAVMPLEDGVALPGRTLSMNAYLGALPIAAAFARGADVVVTGRVADSALVLGPLMHAFGWSSDDYDRLAQGSLAGHVIECGAQCTGGNFTDWESVPRYDDMGFPIIECAADGSFIVTKPQGTGGLVTTHTVGEQILYEIGDPRAYLLPDVVCDFTTVRLEQVGPDRVLVSGARGLPPTATYKCSATWLDGQRITATFLIGGIDAPRKGARVAQAILERVRRLLAEAGLPDLRGSDVEVLGAEAIYGANARPATTREVVVKIACVHDDKRALRLFAREIAQAATGMAPGLTGIIGGRPKESPRVRLHSCLVPKSLVTVCVDIDGDARPVAVPVAGGFDPAMLRAQPRGPTAEGDTMVPLLWLAVARSGDKGDHANIGVIARERSHLPWLRAALTEQAVAAYMAHVLDPVRGRVTRWEVPGIGGFNFLLEHALGGGGIASLRIDPQGKAFAQQLLDFPVQVPAALAAALAQERIRVPRGSNTGADSSLAARLSPTTSTESIVEPSATECTAATASRST